MSGEDKELETSKQNSEIRDMVAFLLNSSTNDEQVLTISKRLLAKVYT